MCHFTLGSIFTLGRVLLEKYAFIETVKPTVLDRDALMRLRHEHPWKSYTPTNLSILIVYKALKACTAGGY